MVLMRLLTGLIAGLASTAAMSLAEYPIWRRWGMEAVSEWHVNQVLMARFLQRPAKELVIEGLALHFLHGGLAGIVFALLLPIIALSISVVEAGVVFGLILWIVALLIMKPVTGVGFFSHPLRLLSLVVNFLVHLLYGILLGLMVSSAI